VICTDVNDSVVVVVVVIIIIIIIIVINSSLSYLKCTHLVVEWCTLEVHV